MTTNESDQVYWVAIGASAGGLEAIQGLCKALPEGANMIYIVAQHLSPKHNSMLTELVQRNVKLKVETVKDGIQAQPNTIYITPPQKDIYVEKDLLRLTSASDQSVPKPSINALFVSLAEEKKDHAVGIILSGTGSDGAHGIKTIKACGGLTIAQSPKTCKYSGMPMAAVNTDCVDHVLSPSEIGDHLCKLSTQLPKDKLLSLEKKEANDSFSDLVAMVRKQCGVNFKNYKKATLQRRIERRMLSNSIEDFDEYVDFTRQNTEELHLLYKDILISVTDFFRDKASFEQLNEILAQILDKKEPHEPVRIWTVGCATGEEAYSLAILLAEAAGGVDCLADKNFQIFATDVDAEALAVARRGVYSEATMVNVPDEYVTRYFTRRKDTYEVIKPIKDIVLFASHNVIEDPPFLRIDLITCRNLLIYFDQELQKKIYGIFHYALRQSSFLFLGKSESTSHVTQLFRAIRSKEKIFQKRNNVPNSPGLYLANNSSFQDKSSQVRHDIEKSTLPAMHESLIRQLGDAALTIDDNFNIEHVYGDATPYITIANGKPVWNLAEIINAAHRQELRALVFKALRTNETVMGQPKKIKIDGKIFKDRLKIYPLNNSEAAEKCLLVVFERLGRVTRRSKDGETEASSEQVKELQDELSAAREHLQTVIEELETSNEELQSMNEELQSSNEELQSSNEELETTNEELQSANEELVTMNDELNTKTVALEQTSSQLVNIKNSFTFPIIVVDNHGIVARGNEAARQYFKFSNDAKQPLMSLLPDEFDRDQIDAQIRKVQASGATEKVQLEKDNQFFWLHITPYKQRNNATEGVVLGFIENTEWVKNKRQLIESRKKAQAANIAKSEFLANISHEIRTPLNAICGVSEIFEFGKVTSEKQEQLVGILKNSTQNLRELLDDMLDFAKLEAGQLQLDYSKFSLSSLLSSLTDVYSIAASRNENKLVTRVEKNVPDSFIGDALRIKQIIGNLLSNSAKFTEQGTITVSVEGEDNDDVFELQISVDDTGIGMDEQELSKVFNKFVQSDASISRKYGGTGLGLSIVKELVTLMNGRIGVDSIKGRGTTFNIHLPLRRSDAKTQSTTTKQSTSLTKETIETDGSILIVEDNESNIFVATSYLDQLGVDYDVAKSGKEALTLFKGKDYAVVLLDIQMDEMNGFEFFEHLKVQRSDSKAGMPKVIAMTAHVQKDVAARCHSVGMDDFLPKPIDMGKLKRTLNKHLT